MSILSAVELSNNESESILKYLKYMTNDDLSLAQLNGYLTDELLVTHKGYIELKDIARVKVYPAKPILSALDKLFI